MVETFLDRYFSNNKLINAILTSATVFLPMWFSQYLKDINVFLAQKILLPITSIGYAFLAAIFTSLIGCLIIIGILFYIIYRHHHK